MSLHRTLLAAEIHVFHSYEYADAAARLAATGFTPADVGRVARQLDNGSFWALSDDSPIVWSELTGLGPPPPHGTTHTSAGSDPVPNATTLVAGLMSAADKVKLDSIAGGNVTTPIRNESGATILKGRLVYPSGYSIPLSKILVGLADKDDSTKRPAIGIAIADIPNNTDADILVVGTLVGMDTSAFALTDQLVLSSAGAFTRPPPDTSPFTGEIQNIGSVSRVHATDGEIVISIDGLSVVTGPQVFALAGTSGTPGPTNKYVTDADPRNTNTRVPTAHAASHIRSGTDELDGDLVDIDFVPTNYTRTVAAPATDVEHLTSHLKGVDNALVNSFDLRDILVWDHFISGNLDTDELGSAGWRVSVAGTGADIALSGEAGHPGIVDFGCGTVLAGRSAIHLGEAAIGCLLLNAVQNTIHMEWLVRVNANFLAAANLERWICGYGDSFDVAAGTETANGIYIDFDPSADTHFRLRTANGGARSTAAGATVVAAATWYRLGIQVSYPGGVPTAQMFVNGVADGAALTTNIPAALVGIGIRGDSNATAAEARFQADYVKVNQTTAKET